MVRYTAVDDIGNVINQVLADGQIVGGIVQEAGHVFGEYCQYDADDGQLITGSFMDYCMPRAELIPQFNLSNHVVPSPNNPLGVKGVGEAGSTGSDAGLHECGVECLAHRRRRAVRHAGNAGADLERDRECKVVGGSIVR